MEVQYFDDTPKESYQILGGIVALRFPFEIWQKNWLLLYMECFMYALDILIISYAWKRDKHTLYYGLASAVSVGYAELSILIFPNSRSWWYEHFMISLFKGHIPVFTYATYFVIYAFAIIIAKSARFPRIVEAWLSTVFAFLFIVNLDQFGGDHAMWIYSNSDPTLKDRFFTIPWAEIYLLSFLPVNMTLISDTFLPASKDKHTGFPIIAILFSAAVAGTLTYIEYITAYGILCMYFGGNTMLVGFIIPILLTAMLYLLKPELWITYSKFSGHSPISPHAFKWRTTFLGSMCVVAFLIKPENIRMIGPHQSIGPCGLQENVINQIFLPVTREKYICVDKAHELDSWDFHCLSKLELDSLKNKTTQWYPICGKPIKNRTNFVTTSIAAFVISTLAYQKILRSGQRKNGDIKKIH